MSFQVRFCIQSQLVDLLDILRCNEEFDWFASIDRNHNKCCSVDSAIEMSPSLSNILTNHYLHHPVFA